MASYSSSRIVCLFISFFLLAQTAFAVSDTYPFEKQNDRTRFYTLIHEVRCVVCQNQSVSDSSAPLANDLRDKIYEMVLAQKTNKEITNFLAERYGDFILFNPRLTKSTLLLWIFPLLASLIGLFFIFNVVKNKK